MILIVLAVVGLFTLGAPPAAVGVAAAAALATRGQWRRERPPGYRALPAVAR